MRVFLHAKLREIVRVANIRGKRRNVDARNKRNRWWFVFRMGTKIEFNFELKRIRSYVFKGQQKSYGEKKTTAFYLTNEIFHSSTEHG